MSADLAPGDFVECIEGYDGYLVVGAVYRIKQIWAPEFHLVNDGGIGVDLVGAPPADNDSWRIERFRPIYRPNSQLIEQLKRAAPTDAPADAPNRVLEPSEGS